MVDDDPQPGTERGPIRVLTRACMILDCLAEAREPIGVSDISRKTELSKSTVHYLLQTLTALELAVFDGTHGRYMIGGAATRWASAFAGSYDPLRVAGPYLESLRDATGETVTLHLRSGDFRICIAQELSPHPLRRIAEVGVPKPLWLSATGRALLSTLSDEQVGAYLARVHREPPTPKTPTDADEILQLVRDVRQAGFALADDENEVGVSALSAPIVAGRGGSVMAISVAGPAQRWTHRAIEQAIPLIRDAADAIAHKSGGMSADG